MTTENVNFKIARVNLMIDHKEMDLVGYEFKVVEEILIEESGCEQRLFRCDVDKKSGEIVVYCAYSEDFDVMEEATWYFDTKKLLDDINAWMEKVKGTEDEVTNHGDVYVKYVKLRDEGYECDNAVMMAYDY